MEISVLGMSWVEHVPVVGEQNTEAAGAYPEELTTMVAIKYQLKVKSNRINNIQVKRLENEERRRKRVYEENAPSKTDSIIQEQERQKFETKTLEAKEREIDGDRKHAAPQQVRPRNRPERRRMTSTLAACATLL